MGDAVDVRFSFPPYRWEGFRHSIAAYYVTEYLRGAGLDASQHIDPTPLGSLDRIAEEIVAVDARAYGFVVYDTNALLAMALARRVRRLRPDRLVVCGGPFCEPRHNHAVLLAEGAPFDYVLTGCGYRSMAGLLANGASVGDAPPASVRGLAFRGPDGSISRAPRAKPLPLAETPSPYLSGSLPLDDYYDSEGHFALIRSKGCTGHCLFCNYAVRSGFRVDTVPLSRTLAELDVLAAFARARGELCHVMLLDDDFAADLPGAKEFCLRVIDAGHPEVLRFYSHMSTSRADTELIDLMVRAGFGEVNFGIESGVPRVLHAMRKLHAVTGGATDLAAEREYLERTRSLIEHVRRVGLSSTASFVTGMPFETQDDALETLEYIKTLALDEYSVNRFTPLSGSVYTRQKRGAAGCDPRYATLPPRMLYPFDPTMIPRLEHAFVYPTVKIPLYFTGDFSESRELPSGQVHPSLVLVSAGERGAPPWQIEPVLNIGDHLFVEIESEAEIADIDKACVEAELPAMIVNYVFPVCDSGPPRELFVHPQYEVTSIIRTGLSHLDRVELAFDGRPRRAADTTILATAEEGDDLERFLGHLVETIEARDGPVALADLFHGRHPLNVMHGCRWSVWGCPATKLGLLVCNVDGSVSPCVGGPRVAPPHLDRHQLQTRMRDCVEAARDGLGCDACSAHRDCPRCVSLAGVSRERYCELIRSRLWLTHVLPIMRLLGESASIETLPSLTVGFTRRQTYMLGPEEQGAAAPGHREHGCYVACDDGQYLVVDVRCKVCYRVDPVTALLVEASRREIEDGQLAALLGARHDMGRAEAWNRIEGFRRRIWDRAPGSQA